jgi:hypothetical protein
MGVTKSRPLTVTGTLDFPEVSPETYLEVMCDVRASLSMMPDFISIQWIRGKDNICTPGAVWLEEWRYGNKRRKCSITTRVAMIELEFGPELYRYSATAQLVHKPCAIPYVMNTFTWEAQALPSQNGCRVHFSNAFVPEGWYARLVAGTLFRRLFVDDLDKHYRENMQFVYQEALRRTVARLRQDLSDDSEMPKSSVKD